MKEYNLTPKLYPLPKNTGKSILLHHYPGHPDFLFHYHPEYELVMTRGSAGKRVIGDSIEEYSRLDFVLLGPNIPHTWVSEKLLEPAEKSNNTVVHFTRESLGLDFLAKPEMQNVLCLLDQSARGQLFPAPLAHNAEPLMDRISASEGLEQLLTFYSVLRLLADSENRRPIVSEKYDCSCIDTDSPDLSKALEYIYHHNDRPISLEEMASHLRMSIPTFTRFFRRVTGKSFVVYLNEWRIRRSCVLLNETDWSILDISLKAGFSNLSNFNRQFLKLMNITPREYRQKQNKYS